MDTSPCARPQSRGHGRGLKAESGRELEIGWSQQIEARRQDLRLGVEGVAIFPLFMGTELKSAASDAADLRTGSRLLSSQASTPWGTTQRRRPSRYTAVKETTMHQSLGYLPQNVAHNTGPPLASPSGFASNSDSDTDDPTLILAAGAATTIAACGTEYSSAMRLQKTGGGTSATRCDFLPPGATQHRDAMPPPTRPRRSYNCGARVHANANPARNGGRRAGAMEGVTATVVRLEAQFSCPLPPSFSTSSPPSCFRRQRRLGTAAGELFRLITVQRDTWDESIWLELHWLGKGFVRYRTHVAGPNEPRRWKPSEAAAKPSWEPA
ncbi:hypothetical protein DFH09DRAFT_1091098 [Mycena vulgaris]|nr:hypothetical protein DFH09DRAFT_1091098 [Mycena vulgaris]